ncbi:unnamed protein product [Soboliphyme baturini]|uniref:ABC transmembrane type-1 domain-containing protein n=1 Tax=Soboliphyme baturini TaxID=241478 RepID=A0A183IM69_9BILA|nr:unnamed protein product [Soboliphyme baturini]
MFTFADEVITYNIGVLPSQFYVVLGGKDENGYNSLVIRAMLITIGKALVPVFLLFVIVDPSTGYHTKVIEGSDDDTVAEMLASLKFTTNILYLHWRRLITTRMHLLYLKKFVFYHICQTCPVIDNPWEHVSILWAQDIEKTSLYFSNIFVNIILAPFIIIFYMYQTWKRTDYIGPVAVIIYFIVATVFNKFFMSPVAKVVFQQERKEGNFRFKHVAIRNNAEAIAFYKAASLEKCLADQELKSLLSTQQKLMIFQYPLIFIINFFDYFGAYLSYMIVGVTIFYLHIYDHASTLELTGIISKVCETKFHVIGWVVQFYETLREINLTVDWSSKESDHGSSSDSVTRDQINGDSDADDRKQLLTTESNQDIAFRLQNLSYRQPQTNVLLLKGICIKNLPCRLPDVFFSPQKPYFPRGSLRQQIIYPTNASAVPMDPEERSRLDDLLRLVKLEQLLHRANGFEADITWDWGAVLTPGEMQRLSILRVLYHKPQIAFLDEATSAVTDGVERDIYESLRKEGITYVSVGHRTTLEKYHDLKLHIGVNGSWSISEINRSKM